MKTFVKIINKDNVVIYSDLLKEQEHYFSLCVDQNILIDKCDFSSKKIRHGKLTNEHGIAYLFTYDHDLINKPRYFKEKLRVYSEQLIEINNIKSKLVHDIQVDNRRLIHNITSFNAHNIQELYLIVPEEKLSKDYKAIKETVKSYLLNDPDAVADAFLRIAKNSIAMKAEFTVFKKLDGGPSTLQKQTHNIRKVILTVLHVFYQDFKELDVYVSVEENDKFLKFDFETIRVALYHIIDNTVKYILPNTQLKIKFIENYVDGSYSILFDMISMEIKNSEVNDVVREGYSGVYARQGGKNGDGLGLYIVNKILNLNHSELIIHINQSPFYSKKVDNINYVRNIFELKFNNISGIHVH
ncbi:MAG: sensor histidine kinase [Cytophaga sp.]|uniref:sensor histidine kinase n=1 Tax=Cytophaga sp. TaxID=29535 RepID=UPI003F7E8CC4